MINKKQLPAFPQLESEFKGNNIPSVFTKEMGLTKRELIAAMCLQGLLANPVYNNPNLRHTMVTVPDTAACALSYADALLTQLENTSNG